MERECKRNIGGNAGTTGARRRSCYVLHRVSLGQPQWTTGVVPTNFPCIPEVFLPLALCNREELECLDRRFEVAGPGHRLLLHSRHLTFHRHRTAGGGISR